MKEIVNTIKDILIPKVYASRTFAADPLQKFKFKVAVVGTSPFTQNIEMGFTNVGGVSRELEVIKYLEAGFDFEHKLPGRETVGEITFKKGMYADKSMHTAFSDVVTNKNATRCDVNLYIMDRWQQVKRTFAFMECWFSKYEFEDLDASSSDVIIETLTMQYEQLKEV